MTCTFGRSQKTFPSCRPIWRPTLTLIGTRFFQNATDALRRIGVDHTTLQLEPEPCGQGRPAVPSRRQLITIEPQPQE